MNDESCICNQFKTSEIKNLLKSSIEKVLEEECLIIIFKKTIEHNSETKKYLDIVYLASKLHEAPTNNKNLEEKLMSLITMDFYTKLSKPGANKRKIFKNIKKQYSNKIKKSNDYKRFRSDMENDKYTIIKTKKGC